MGRLIQTLKNANEHSFTVTSGEIISIATDAAVFPVPLKVTPLISAKVLSTIKQVSPSATGDIRIPSFAAPTTLIGPVIVTFLIR